MKDAARLAIYKRSEQGVEQNQRTSVTTVYEGDTTTGASIFSEVLNAFDKFGLDLSTLCGIATDGARAMSGTGIGFVGLLKSALKEKNISDNIAISHCIIY